mgnify:CR=1 FL=1
MNNIVTVERIFRHHRQVYTFVVPASEVDQLVSGLASRYCDGADTNHLGHIEGCNYEFSGPTGVEFKIQVTFDSSPKSAEHILQLEEQSLGRFVS